MRLVDFSLARQCWQAAHWSLLALQRVICFDGDDGGDVGVVNQNQSADASVLAGVDEALSTTLFLTPELQFYGVERVTPILVYPLYDWLYRTHCAAIHAIAGYAKMTPPSAVQMIEALLVKLLRDAAAEGHADGRIAMSDVSTPSEVATEWAWIQHHWASHGDGLAWFLRDVFRLQRQLPGVTLPGLTVPNETIIEAAALIDSSVRCDGAAPGQIPGISALHPRVLANRVTLTHTLLAGLDERWTES